MQQGRHTSMSSSQSLSMFKARSRNLSGELEVFDATLYFSGRVDDVVERGQQRVDRRRSMDASLGAMLVDKEGQKVEDAQFNGIKKSKQPRSPGGLLASFLSNLFHQTSSKKKSKPSVTDAEHCKEKRGKGRRRNSIVLHESVEDGKIVSKEQIKRCSISNSTTGHKNLDPFLTQRSEARTMHYRPVNNEGNEMNRSVLNGSVNVVYNMDPLWAEVFIRKEEENAHERREKGEGNDWRSESSSDLFELKNCGIGGDRLSPSGLTAFDAAELLAPKRGAAAVAFRASAMLINCRCATFPSSRYLINLHARIGCLVYD